MLFNSAKPGVILLVQNYRIGRPKTYDYIPRLRGTAGNLTLLDMEIILGDYTKIQIVPASDDLLRLQIAALPLIEFSFGNRESLEYVIFF